MFPCCENTYKKYIISNVTPKDDTGIVFDIDLLKKIFGEDWEDKYDKGDICLCPCHVVGWSVLH